MTMFLSVCRTRAINNSRTPVQLLTGFNRLMHSSNYRMDNGVTNAQAINMYQELVGIYADQSITPSLKKHIVKGMFISNEINDMSNPVFKRLNGIIRQDPNLVEEEKLDLISVINTDKFLFRNVDQSSFQDPLQADFYDEFQGIEEITLKDFLSNDNFLRKSVTAGVIGLSVISVLITCISI